MGEVGLEGRGDSGRMGKTGEGEHGRKKCRRGREEGQCMAVGKAA